MTKGRRWPAERQERVDRTSGAAIRQFTAHRAHSHHLYFTNPGWYAGGTKLLCVSERENASNLYSITLADGTLTQLSDYGPRERAGFFTGCLNRTQSEFYFWCGGTLKALDMNTLEERIVYERPDGVTTTITNCTADGRYLCTGFVEDTSDRVYRAPGYVGFREQFEARPLSRVVKIDVRSGVAQTVHEDRVWFAHVNTSPKLPNILTFCHEGPWDLVRQRMWGLDIESGKTWKIRPQEPGTALGHEYWMADGERIGYHGRTAEGNVYGFIRYDSSECTELPFPEGSTHFHSNDDTLIVGDGSREKPYLLLWRRNADRFDGPRVLAFHRGSFHVQKVHVHPRFTPDGSQVVYTTDHTGYGQVHLVDVPAFDSLPALGDIS